MFKSYIKAPFGGFYNLTKELYFINYFFTKQLEHYIVLDFLIVLELTPETH